jgi:hypothetical protein
MYILVQTFLKAIYRAASRWQVRCDKCVWRHRRVGCNPTGNEHIVEEKMWKNILWGHVYGEEKRQ